MLYSETLQQQLGTPARSAGEGGWLTLASAAGHSHGELHLAVRSDGFVGAVRQGDKFIVTEEVGSLFLHNLEHLDR
jgi:hypothetical protein